MNEAAVRYIRLNTVREQITCKKQSIWKDSHQYRQSPGDFQLAIEIYVGILHTNSFSGCFEG